MLKDLDWDAHESRVLYVLTVNRSIRGYLSSPPLQAMVRLRLWDKSFFFVHKHDAERAVERLIKN